MLFTYGCDTCGLVKERFVLSAKRDDGANCECGGTFARKRDSTGGLQRGGRRRRLRRSEATDISEARAAEEAKSQVDAPFHMEAKNSTFAGNWTVSGYEAVFAGNYENCNFSANIVHRQKSE